MSRTPSPEESRQMLKWLNRTRSMLLDYYKNQYVASIQILPIRFLFNYWSLDYRTAGAMSKL